MRKQMGRRILAWMLACSMLTGTIPSNAFGADVVYESFDDDSAQAQAQAEAAAAAAAAQQQAEQAAARAQAQAEAEAAQAQAEAAQAAEQARQQAEEAARRAQEAAEQAAAQAQEEAQAAAQAAEEAARAAQERAQEEAASALIASRDNVQDALESSPENDLGETLVQDGFSDFAESTDDVLSGLDESELLSELRSEEALPEEEAPAIHFSDVEMSDGTLIDVDIPAGALPKGTDMRIRRMDFSDGAKDPSRSAYIKSTVEEAVGQELSSGQIAAYDMYFYDETVGEDTHIQPKLPVTLTFKRVRLDGDRAVVFHVPDAGDGKISVVSASDANPSGHVEIGGDGLVTITVEKAAAFSVYAVAGYDVSSDILLDPFEVSDDEDASKEESASEEITEAEEAGEKEAEETEESENQTNAADVQENIPDGFIAWNADEEEEAAILSEEESNEDTEVTVLSESDLQDPASDEDASDHEDYDDDLEDTGNALEEDANEDVLIEQSGLNEAETEYWNEAETEEFAESLAEDIEEETETADEIIDFGFFAFEDGSTVHVTAPSSAFDEEVQLTVTKVDSETVLTALSEATGRGELSAEDVAVYDFDFYTEEEHDIEPKMPVMVTYGNLPFASDAQMDVYHMENADDVNALPQTILEMSDANMQGVSLTEQTSAFSLHAIVAKNASLLAASPDWWNDFTYELDTSGDVPLLILLKYKGSDTSYTVPGSATINGTTYTTQIGDGTSSSNRPFSGSTVQNLTIGSGAVVKIGNASYGQFEGNTTLRSIDLTGAVIQSGKWLFSRCSNLHTVLGLNLDGVSNTDSLFNSCSNLKTIQLTSPKRLSSGAGLTGTWINMSTKEEYSADAMNGGTELPAGTYAKEISINFSGNGGTASPRSITGYIGEAVSDITLPTASNPGADFIGWFTAANGGEQLSDTITTDSYYAQWDYHNYTLVLNANGGLPADDVSVQLSYDQYYALSSNTFSRENYYLKGWNTRADGTGTSYGADASVGKLTTVDGETVTLYAQWGDESDLIIVTFDSQGGSEVPVKKLVPGSGIGYMYIPTKTEDGVIYTFMGWYTRAEGGSSIAYSSTNLGYSTVKPTTNTTYYAHWQRSPVVHWDSNGGAASQNSRIVDYNGKVGTLPSASYGNRVLVGWFTEATGGTQISADTTVRQDVTYYAHWGWRPSFNADGGVIATDLETAYPAQEDKNYKIQSLPEATRDGYTLEGWYIGSRKITAGMTVDVDANPEITAHWKRSDVITVTLDPNGGTVSRTEIQVVKGEEIGQLPNPSSRSGYEFAGWAYPNGTIATTASKFTKDTTLTAQWKEKTVTVAFVLNLGEEDKAEPEVQFASNTANGYSHNSNRTIRYIKIPSGSSVNTLPAALRSGYILEGWYPNANGTGTKLTDTRTFSTDATYYAKWVPEVTEKSSSTLAYKFGASWVNASNNNVDNLGDNLEFHPTSETDVTATLHARFELNQSVKTTLPVGSVSVRVPMYIWKDWDGNPVGTCTISQVLPLWKSETETGASGSNFFSYYVDEATQEYVILNNQELGGGSGVDFTLSYQVAPYEVPGGAIDVNGRYVSGYNYYGDDTKADLNGVVPVKFAIDNNKDGRAEISQTRNLHVEMHTKESGSSSKSFENIHYSWNSSWGTAPEDAADYFYIEWEIYDSVSSSTNQPYYLEMSEDTVHDGSVVYISRNGIAKSTSSRQNGYFYDDISRYFYVVTKHPISELANIPEEGRTFNNEAILTDHWRSGYSIERRVKASHTIYDQQYPKGEFDKHINNWTTSSNHYKTGGQETIVDENGTLSIPYEITYGMGTSRVMPVFWNNDTQTYSTATRTIDIRDGLSGDVMYSSGLPSAKYVWEPSSGNVILNDDDYYISYLTFDTDEFDARCFNYNASTATGDWGAEYIHYPASDYGNIDVYVRLQGETDLRFYRSANANGTVYLPANTVGFQILHDTNYYGTEMTIDVGMYLRPTEHVQSLIAEDMALGTTSIIKNRAYCSIYHDLGTERKYAWQDVTDYTGGNNNAWKEIYELDASSTSLYVRKNSASASNTVFDVERGTQDNVMVLDAWNYNTGNKNRKILSGVFYDLLPAGTTVDPDTLYIYRTSSVSSTSYGTASRSNYDSYKNSSYNLDKGLYNVTFTENYQNSGRTMMMISFAVPEEQAYPHYRVYFMLHNTYENVRDRGTTVENDLAFVNTTLNHQAYSSKSYSQSQISEDARGYYDTLQAEYAEDIAYARANANYIPVDAFSWGFSKTVKTKQDYLDEGITRPAFTYTYKLTYAQSDYAIGEKIVFYDVLEGGTADSPSAWHGIFQGVDISALQAKVNSESSSNAKCDPVIYYSTKNRSSFTGSDWNISSSAWTRVKPADEAITAVAIDCSKDTNGEAFVIKGQETLSVYITMKAPDSILQVGENGKVTDLTGTSTTNEGRVKVDTTEDTSTTTVTIEDDEPEHEKEADPATGTKENPTILKHDSELDYILTVKNTDEDFAVPNIVVEDVIPDGLSIQTNDIKVRFDTESSTGTEIDVISSARVNLSQSGQKLVFTILSLGIGETAYITIPTIVQIEEAIFENTSKITSVNGDRKDITSSTTWHEVKPRSTTAELKVYKLYENHDMNRGDFTFTVREYTDHTYSTEKTAEGEDGTVSPVVFEGISAKAASDTASLILFDPLNYTIEDLGSHYYMITEDIPEDAVAIEDGRYQKGAVIYDAGLVPVRVDVLLDAENDVLYTEVNYEENTPTFTNTFNMTGKLTVSKTVINQATAAGNNSYTTFNFTVKLYASAGDELQRTLKTIRTTRYASGTVNTYESTISVSDNNEIKFSLYNGQSLQILGLPDGIRYEVEETAVSGYITSSEGEEGILLDAGVPGTKEYAGNFADFVNTESLSLPFRKIWNDENNADNVRPQSITVRLLADGKTIDTVELTQANTMKVGTRTYEWAYQWENLPRYTESGHEIVYAVVENAVEQYTASSAVKNSSTGIYEITNTHKTDRTSVTVTKEWDDEDDQDGIRPDGISMLGTNFDPSQAVIAWLFVNGQALSMYGTISISGTTYQITNGYPYAFLNKWSGWIYTWEDLPVYLPEGEKIAYTVYEVPYTWPSTSMTLANVIQPGAQTVEGYVLESLSGNAEEGFVLVNKHETETTQVSGTKTWEDSKNQDGMRPASISIRLYANGKEVAQQTVYPKADGTWSYSFTDLPKNSNGKAIVYTLGEDVPEGYTVTFTDAVTDEDGITIDAVNTHETETTKVWVYKHWDDDNNREGRRPSSVQAQLYANGEAVSVSDVADAIVTLNEENNWSYNWTGLDKYRDGMEITYSVAELTDSLSNGYVLSSVSTWEDTGCCLPCAQRRFVITNTYVPELTEVSVQKIWDDGNDQDGLRPEALTVTLWSKTADERVRTKEAQAVLSAQNGWAAVWTGLDAYRGGSAITYTVTEQAVEGYNVSTSSGTETAGAADAAGSMADGFTFTNTHTPETTDVEGVKIWNDNGNQDGVRPQSITVYLFADGVLRETKTVRGSRTAASWSYSWKDLPKYINGKEIVYTVTEQAVEDYSTSISGYDLTNSYAPGKTSVTVSKAWDDREDYDGIRPGTVKVRLLADGSEVTDGTAVLSAENGWAYTWMNLNVYKEGSTGVKVVYTVKEDTVDGYTTVIDGNAADGYVVTNIHVPETVSVNGTKTWDDANNQDGKRPSAIRVQLYANGNYMEGKDQIVTGAGNTWSYSWDGLDKYPKADQSTPIVYTVKELTVDYRALEDYVSAADGMNLTNTHKIETVNVPVVKTWDDAEDQDGLRTPITVWLYADGQQLSENADLLAALGLTADQVKLILSEDGAEGSWYGVFKELPKYADGTEILYTVQEDAVDGYETTTVEGSMTDGYTIINTHAPETTSVKVTKIWDDENNQDGLRPEALAVTLWSQTASEEAAQLAGSAVLNAENGWTYQWTDLPVNRDGEKITYTVTEETIAGYNVSAGADGTESAAPAQAEGSMEEGYTFTNIHVPELIDVPGKKTWDDAGNQDGVRPESITLYLYADGILKDTKTISGSEEEAGSSASAEGSASTAESWSYIWKDLPKYASGREILYTVTEQAISDYSTQISGWDVKNTHTPGKTSVSVTKAWDDASDQDGLRPAGVTVHLIADLGDGNGPAVLEGQDVVLTRENGWTYTWSELDAFTPEGIRIVYSVSEDAVEGYNGDSAGVKESSARITGNQRSGYVITNVHEIEKTEVSVTKVWDDVDNQDNIRPQSIRLLLYADGEFLKDYTLTEQDADENGNWAYTFTGLNRYADGSKQKKEVVYTVREDSVDGYTTMIEPAAAADASSDAGSGWVITNTHIPEMTYHQARKIWNDQDDQDGLRAAMADAGEAVVFYLTRTVNNETLVLNDAGIETLLARMTGLDDAAKDALRTLYAPKTVDVFAEGMDAVVTWDGLPVFEDGMKISYGTEEAPLAGYTTAVGSTSSGASNSGCGICNGSNACGACGTENCICKQLMASCDDADGNCGKVSGCVIINTHIPETIRVDVQKFWMDANDRDGYRPDSLRIRLMRTVGPDAEEEVEHVDLSDANGWKHTFTDLPKYQKDSSGTSQLVTYYVTEDEYEFMDRYTLTYPLADQTVTGDTQQPKAQPFMPGMLALTASVGTGIAVNADGAEPTKISGMDGEVTLVNTHAIDLVSLSGIKVWEDEGNRDGVRPESIVITLLADGERTNDTRVIGAADALDADTNSWAFTFDQLPKFRAGSHGEPIRYTVEETLAEDSPYAQRDLAVETIYSDTWPDEAAGYIFTLTNTYTPQTRSLQVRKEWADEDDTDGIRPTQATVHLFFRYDQDGTTYAQEADVNEAGVFTPIGEAKAYTGTAPEAEGEGTALTQVNDYGCSWTNLPVYLPGSVGVKLKYFVTEDAVNGYTTQIADDSETMDVIRIINFHEVERTHLSVRKDWNDADDQDGIRPTQITVSLTQSYTGSDGSVTTDRITPAVTLTAKEGWTYTWEDLLKYHYPDDFASNEAYADWTERTEAEKAALLYAYDVIENASVEAEAEDTQNAETDGEAGKQLLVEHGGYELQSSRRDTIDPDLVILTNVHVPETLVVEGTKTWDDDTNRDRIRPETITVWLYANGKLVKSQTISQDGIVSTRDICPIIESEDGGDGTTQPETDPAAEPAGETAGETAENPASEPAGEASGETAGNPESDNTGESADEPGDESIPDEQPTEAAETILNTWHYRFENLPRYDRGVELVYTVTESAVRDYETRIDGYDITNTYAPGRTSVSVTKWWDDTMDYDGERPDEVVVHLLADGKEADKAVLNAENKWTWTWNELYEKEAGKAIVYTVEEDVPEHYACTIEGSQAQGYVLKNTHELKLINVIGEKFWDDQDDQDGLRPDYITIHLYGDGELTATKVVTAQENWKYSFRNLKKFREGTKEQEEIVYTILEDAVKGYLSSYQVNGYVEPETETETEPLTETEPASEAEGPSEGGTEADEPSEGTSEAESQGTKPSEKASEAESPETNAQEETSGQEPASTEASAASHTPETAVLETDASVLTRSSDVEQEPGEVPAVDPAQEPAQDESNDPGDNAGDNTGENAGDGSSETEAAELTDYVINLTNTHVPYTTSVKVTKVWDDEKNRDGLRNIDTTVDIQLLADGVPVEENGVLTLNAQDHWMGAWTNLPARKNGVEIVYSVSELTQLEGYEQAIISGGKAKNRGCCCGSCCGSCGNTCADASGVCNDCQSGCSGGNFEYTVTNIHQIDYSVRVAGQKVWEDTEDQDGQRPKEITVRLMANGVEAASQIVTAATDWAFSFDNLPKHVEGVQGVEIVYTVREDAIADYRQRILLKEKTVTEDQTLYEWEITNTHAVGKTSVSVTKVWNDDSNRDKLRPVVVNVQLYADGEAESDPIPLTAEIFWTYTWDNLDVMKDGVKINYTVREVDPADGYDAGQVTGDMETGFTITNTHENEEIDLFGHKLWDDDNDRDRIRPDKVVVRLYADGEEVEGGMRVLSNQNGWDYHYYNLPKYASGKGAAREILYTVLEDVVTGYMPRYTLGSLDITNEHRPATTSVGVAKVWDDANNQDGLRPDAVLIQLYADGQPYGEPAELNAQNSWFYFFRSLPKYEEGVEINYTVQEAGIYEGYEPAEISGNMTDGYLVTNRHVPGKVSIPVHKVWDDNNNALNARPTSITVRLSTDTREVEKRILTSSDGWRTVFENLPMFEDGVEIHYIVSEDEVNGYTAELSYDEVSGSYTLTNHILPDTIGGNAGTPGTGNGSNASGSGAGASASAGSGSGSSISTGEGSSVKTGDETPLMMWILVLMLSAAAAGGLWISLRRRRKEVN